MPLFLRTSEWRKRIVAVASRGLARLGMVRQHGRVGPLTEDVVVETGFVEICALVGIF